MSETACAVYLLICKRFLACFYPAAVYNKYSLSLDILGEEFNASLKVLTDEGYLKLYLTDEKESTENAEGEKAEDEENAGSAEQQKKMAELLSKLKKGDEIDLNGFTIKEGKTSPPKRYTSGSIILAMENAGQLIEDETLREQIKGSGIGTSATRAEILKKLIAQGYIKLNKKTQALSPEKLGEMVFEIVALTIPALLNPKLTASWEKGLTQVAQGETTKQEYMDKLEEFVRSKTTAVIKHGGREKGAVSQRFRYVSQYYK
jgi:DNA topoisomerase-3